MTIADRIRANLKLYGMTQVELAERIGADDTLVARWCIGKHNPSKYYLERIGKVFNCSVPYLIGRYD